MTDSVYRSPHWCQTQQPYDQWSTMVDWCSVCLGKSGEDWATVGPGIEDVAIWYFRDARDRMLFELRWR